MDSRYSLTETSAMLRSAAKAASKGLVEREALVDLILLSAVAAEHLLIIGPPGTAKSAAVRRIAQVLDGQYFEYLLGRFTEPSEIFGPIDFQKLKRGMVETSTKGMLPEADIAFLDEVFMGSTAVLNTLLGVLNERKFRRGHTSLSCPLRVCVAAANHLPEDETLLAFGDRFLVRYFVEAVPDSQLETLLFQGWQSDHQTPLPNVSMERLDSLIMAANNADMSRVNQPLAECIRLLRKENIQLTDRRIVKSQRLISAASVLDGRESPDESDLWPLLHVISRHEDQLTARELLKEKFSLSQNEALTSAAENASLGPLARAQRLVETANELLEVDNKQQNLLALEALGREIDTSFSVDTMPENLKQARVRLMNAIGFIQ